jgi:thioredoxin reductase
MKQHYQLLVVGAGPAGMAAAQSAARQGVEVALIDEQEHPGGQIYRGVDSGPLQQRELLGKDYLFGKPLVQAFRHAPLEYHAATSLWYLDANRQMGVLQQGEHHSLRADHIILAGGAQERPMPIPGWQLPGVMGAGAAQILLKSAAMVPQQEVVLAGNGPLLLLLAWQYLQAGVKISALLDTSPSGSRLRAMRHLPAALAASDYLVKGLRLMLSLRRARIPWYRNVSDLRAEGDDSLRSVSFSAAGRKQHIDCQLLLLHQGVIPALQMPQAAACDLNWNAAQQCWQVARDEWGETSSPGIIVAGDAAAIGGARAAHLDGQLAG